jgi:hypothetical protein
MFISPTFSPCQFAQLSLLSWPRSRQFFRIGSLYPPGHPVRDTALRDAPKGTYRILALKWKLRDLLVWWDGMHTVVGSNPTEVTTVLFLCHKMCTFSLPATLQTMLKFCNTFHWRLSQIPNTQCVMQCNECEWRRKVLWARTIRQQEHLPEIKVRCYSTECAACHILIGHEYDKLILGKLIEV